MKVSGKCTTGVITTNYHKQRHASSEHAAQQTLYKWNIVELFIKKIPTHIWVALSSWVSRIISAAIQLLSIRYLLDMMGENGYAAFTLLAGLVAWGTLADFGIGYSLQNFISEQRANKKKYNDYILTSACLILIGILVLMSTLWSLTKFLAPAYLQGFDVHTISDKHLLLYITLCIFIFTSFGGVLYKIWFAEQRGWIANVITALSSLLGLMLIIIFSKYRASASIYLAVIMFFGPAALIPVVIFIARILKTFKTESIKKFNFNLVNKVLKRASGFVLFSFLATIVLQADYIVMSQKLAASDIIIYTVLIKVFGLVLFVYSALLQALWPVCAEYRVQNKWSELNSIVSKYITLGAIFIIVCSIGFYLFKIQIIGLISKKINTNIDITTIALFCAYFLLRIWSDTYAMLLQSMNYLRPLWYLVPVQAILSLSLQWTLASVYGMKGMLTGLILSFLFTVVIFLPVFYKRKIRELQYV